MKKHYLNLSNGIEWLQHVQESNEPYSFIRIQSTTIERKDWIKLLSDLDHDILLHLALGYTCVIYDKGTNRPYSKTIYYDVPLIKYILNRFWYGIIPQTVKRINRDGSLGEDLSAYFDSVYNTIFMYDQNKEKNSVKTKLKYYKRFLNSTEVHLKGVSESTGNDGNYPLFRETLINNYGK